MTERFGAGYRAINAVLVREAKDLLCWQVGNKGDLFVQGSALTSKPAVSVRQTDRQIRSGSNKPEGCILLRVQVPSSLGELFYVLLPCRHRIRLIDAANTEKRIP